MRHLLIGPTTPGLPLEANLHNVNGPSVIRMPDWAPGLGRYHLYFAHHLGASIRLAYSDVLTGPWTMHGSPALNMDDTPAWGAARHIASPDVHVDPIRRTIRMYYHSPVAPDFPSLVPQPEPWEPRQETHLATSSNGVSFVTEDLGHSLAPPYLRMWRGTNAWFGISMPDITVRSRDGVTGFEAGPRLAQPRIRHVGVQVADGDVTVFFTRVGDAPEHIVASRLLHPNDIDRWQLTPPVEVLSPAESWEGADVTVAQSQYGAARTMENALRDPYVFLEGSRRYLFYGAGGEQAIGFTEL